MTKGGAPQAPAEFRPPTGRFGRQDRLQSQTEFRAVMRRGRRARGPHFVMIALRSTHPRSRIGLAVAKAAGHAPQRARLRRLLRESFRALRGLCTFPSDVVVMAQIPWPGAGLAAVQAELARLGAQVHVWSAAMVGPADRPGGRA